MPKQPLIYLTDEQKHQIRKYKARHPDMTRPSLALWAKGQFNLAKTPCKTTICRILNLEIRDRAYEASDYGFQDDCISISSDDNGQGGEHEFGKENDEDEEGEEQEVKIDVEQDTDVTFEAEKTCRSDNWSLKQKLRALFVVIPLLDPFTQKQQEAYGVLYELYIRLKIPGQEQELIEANKRNSLSLVMRLLDRSVESHRSTYVVPSQELDKLSDDD
ncbi:hypothetical protein BGX28_009608 [Mortierella sp. GBA30]|nr:hypothetical protein BGX28_009608 [Mortierella sp. GBA30]